MGGMMDGGRSLFDSLKRWSDLQDLVDEAAPEGVYLECKTQTGATLGKGTKNQLAESVSAMSNASGGVILLGVSTTAVKADGLDVVSGLEPIGNVGKLAARVEIELPQLTVPPVVGSQVRAIKKGKSASGIVAIYVPPTLGDPVRSATDYHFYFRGSDGDTRAPYEVIRRLFSASDVPDLRAVINQPLSARQEDGSFKLPIVLVNDSSAIARDITVSVTAVNPHACLDFKMSGFKDMSELNPGSTIFMKSPKDVVHRGLAMAIGHIEVTMAGARIPRRILEIEVTLYADKMRARSYSIRANLKKAGLEVKSVDGPNYLY
jgi:hypothetical protein